MEKFPNVAKNIEADSFDGVSHYTYPHCTVEHETHLQFTGRVERYYVPLPNGEMIPREKPVYRDEDENEYYGLGQDWGSAVIAHALSPFVDTVPYFMKDGYLFTKIVDPEKYKGIDMYSSKEVASQILLVYFLTGNSDRFCYRYKNYENGNPKLHRNIVSLCSCFYHLIKGTFMDFVKRVEAHEKKKKDFQKRDLTLDGPHRKNHFFSENENGYGYPIFFDFGGNRILSELTAQKVCDTLLQGEIHISHIENTLYFDMQEDICKDIFKKILEKYKSFYFSPEGEKYFRSIFDTFKFYGFNSVHEKDYQARVGIFFLQKRIIAIEEGIKLANM